MESNVTRMITLLEGTGNTITIEKSQGEFRVPAPDGYEDGAYYTDSKEDAAGTAQKVFGPDIIIKYRSVAEFVGGKYEKYRPKGVKESLDEGYHDEKRVKDILKAQKALDDEKYGVRELGMMSVDEQKNLLGRLESKIEKKGIKSYTPSHLS